jgi:hypothetical protein
MNFANGKTIFQKARCIFLQLIFFLALCDRYNNVGHTAQVDSFSGPSLGNASGTGSSTSTKKSLAEVKGETLGVGEKVFVYTDIVHAILVYKLLTLY